MPKVYDKPFLDFPTMIKYLQDNYGLIIKNEDFALHALKTYSYYDLINGYKDCMMVNNRFKSGVTIEALCNFYLFDKSFQNILFTHIILIENYFKTILSYQIAKDFGVDETVYLSLHNYNHASRTINCPKLLNDIQSIYLSKNVAMPSRHYRQAHNHLPPWILFKNISFGKSINLFRVLKSPQKNAVANELIPNNNIKMGRKIDYLISGLNLIRNCRNTIAHNLKFITFKRGPKEALRPAEINVLTPNELIQVNSSPLKFDYAGVYAVVLFIYTLLNDNVLKNNYCLYIAEQISKNPEIFTEYARAVKLPLDLKNRLNALMSNNHAPITVKIM